MSRKPLPHEMKIPAPRGIIRIETLFVFLGLAIAAAIIFATTKTPIATRDPLRTVFHKECTEPCTRGQPPLRHEPAATSDRNETANRLTPSSEWETRSEAETQEKKPTHPGQQTDSSHFGTREQTSRLPSTAAAPTRTIPATEPITTRPVANRFDFIGPAIVATVAEYQPEPSRRNYAALPATELDPLQSAKISTAPKPNRVLRSLPPRTTLTADNSQPTAQPDTRPAKAPQVAGWRMIRTLKTKEVSEEDEREAALLLELPGKKPETPATAIISPQKPAKISRRVRRRTPKRKTKAAPTTTPSPTSWKNRALFHDN